MAKLWVFIPKKLQKKPSKMFFLMPFQIRKLPESSSKKNTFFEILKFKNLRNHWAKFKKKNRSQILSLRACKWRSFEKVSILVDLPNYCEVFQQDYQKD